MTDGGKKVSTIRPATADDAGPLLAMVRAMAVFDGDPDRVVATEADFRRDGFGPDPRFEALIAEIGKTPVGYALYYPSYTAWEGACGLFLEDLYLAEAARGHGLGRRIMALLARIARDRGWTRIDLRVRADNRARAFYHRTGMAPLDGWLPYKVAGPALDDLAREAESVAWPVTG